MLGGFYVLKITIAEQFALQSDFKDAVRKLSCQYDLELKTYFDEQLIMNDLTIIDTDLLFLNLEIVEKSSEDIIDQLRLVSKNKHTKIVLVTDKKEIPVDVLRTGISDYLRLPFSYDDLNEIIKNYILEHTENDFFRFKFNSRSYKVKYSEILYFENSGRKIIIYTKEKPMSFYGNMDEVEKLLDANFFRRIHKSFIINRHYIIEQNSKFVRMANGAELLISRPYRNDNSGV